MLQGILKNFNLYFDGIGGGQGYAGEIDELTLPKLTTKNEEMRHGGMDAPIDVDMGMEKLEMDFSLTKVDSETATRFGLIQGAYKQLVARGGVENEVDGSVTPVVVTANGRVKEIDFGGWKSGDKAMTKYMVALSYYRLEIDGATMIEIDVRNMIRNIGGTDQNAELRAAIGL